MNESVEYRCTYCGEWEPADGDGTNLFCESCGSEIIPAECDSRPASDGKATR